MATKVEKGVAGAVGLAFSVAALGAHESNTPSDCALWIMCNEAPHIPENDGPMGGGSGQQILRGTTTSTASAAYSDILSITNFKR